MEWADDQGFAYTELLARRHRHPHRVALVSRDGTMRISSILALPRHASLDRSNAAGDVQAEVVAREVEAHIAARGFSQVMNHPDIHQVELETFLSANPVDGRADWTAHEAAEWWMATHTPRLCLEASRKGRQVTLTAESRVVAVVVEFLQPDGSRTERVVSIDAEESRTVVADGASG